MRFYFIISWLDGTLLAAHFINVITLELVTHANGQRPADVVQAHILCALSSTAFLGGSHAIPSSDSHFLYACTSHPLFGMARSDGLAAVLTMMTQ